VQRGAKTDVIDAKGRSIMHYAAKNTPESIEAVFSLYAAPLPTFVLTFPLNFCTDHPLVIYKNKTKQC
jgi:hypothetical protein